VCESAHLGFIIERTKTMHRAHSVYVQQGHDCITFHNYVSTVAGGDSDVVRFLISGLSDTAAAVTAAAAADTDDLIRTASVRASQ